MNRSSESLRQALSARKRLGLLALALVLSLPLAMAARLTPDRHGSGTHQQLGLPPCSFKVFVGLPCPSCGMTTSWAHLVRGQLGRALRANVGGTLLGLIDAVAAAWLTVSALAGRWLPAPPPGDRVLAWAALALTAITLLDWGVRLAMLP